MCHFKGRVAIIHAGIQSGLQGQAPVDPFTNHSFFLTITVSTAEVKPKLQ